LRARAPDRVTQAALVIRRGPVDGAAVVRPDDAVADLPADELACPVAWVVGWAVDGKGEAVTRIGGGGGGTGG